MFDLVVILTLAMDTQVSVKIPLLGVNSVKLLEFEGVRWDQRRLEAWWSWMGRSRCTCGLATPHCCPFTVLIGEGDYGLHAWVQWALFREHGLLTQTVHECCQSGDAKVGNVKVDHDKSVDYKDANHQVGDGRVGDAAEEKDKSVDSPNGMLMPVLGITSKTKKRKERRRKLAAAKIECVGVSSL